MYGQPKNEDELYDINHHIYTAAGLLYYTKQLICTMFCVLDTVGGGASPSGRPPMIAPQRLRLGLCLCKQGRSLL